MLQLRDWDTFRSELHNCHPPPPHPTSPNPHPELHTSRRHTSTQHHQRPGLHVAPVTVVLCALNEDPECTTLFHPQKPGPTLSQPMVF